MQKFVVNFSFQVDFLNGFTLSIHLKMNFHMRMPKIILIGSAFFLVPKLLYLSPSTMSWILNNQIFYWLIIQGLIVFYLKLYRFNEICSLRIINKTYDLWIYFLTMNRDRDTDTSLFIGVTEVTVNQSGIRKNEKPWKIRDPEKVPCMGPRWWSCCSLCLQFQFLKPTLTLN